jgi:hypothetical protein
MVMQQQQSYSGKRGSVSNVRVGRQIDKQIYWERHLERVQMSQLDHQEQIPNPRPPDEGFSLDRQGILQEINRKAQEIEKMNMNRTDIRNNVPRNSVDASDNHVQIGQHRDQNGGQNNDGLFAKFNGSDSVLPAPILPQRDDGSKVLPKGQSFVQDSGQMKYHETRKSKPRLHTDVMRHRHGKKITGRPTSKSVQLLQRVALDKLSLDRRKDLKDSKDRHSFNVSAGDALPLNRHVPDTRPEA